MSDFIHDYILIKIMSANKLIWYNLMCLNSKWIGRSPCQIIGKFKTFPPL